MSWDVVLFNSSQKIILVEDIDEGQLKPTDFCSVLSTHFKEIAFTDNHRSIKGRDFFIDYFFSKEPSSNMMLSLYGENGLYELVILAKKHGWQIFDTGNGTMIDLENPENNGYESFQNYLKYVLNSK